MWIGGATACLAAAVGCADGSNPHHPGTPWDAGVPALDAAASDATPPSSGSPGAPGIAGRNARAGRGASAGAGRGSGAGAGRGQDAGAGQGAGTPSTPPPTRPPEGPTAFPLQVSANGRYLVDRNGAPFLINQASSWGLIQTLSTADATSYLDNLQERGFNTVMISIISFDDRMAGSPPNWQGIAPFTKRWDFSTWNEAYFAHADEIIRLADQRHMLVTLVPAYLGFPQDSTQGWADELLHASNDVEKSRAYGRFLGERYADFPNILWIAGGDNQPKAGSELEARLKAIVEGIREKDSVHLWTGHWDGQGSGSLARDNRAFAAWMDVNGYYAYNYDRTSERDLESYAMYTGQPLIHLDMSYETESGGSPENIRRKAYGVILNGGAGSSFCAGPDWYLFFKWRNMDTQATRETTYWWNLFKSRAWYELVPDTKHEVVTAGYGELASASYVSAASSGDGRLLVAYLPGGGAISVDLGKLAGEQSQLWWYDPTTGTAMSGGMRATQGVVRLTPPARKSWVLVIDDAALGLTAPGG